LDQNLQECLQGTESRKYIMPFFWQHGEPHDILLEEIEVMERANIREFCVESRTHEEFGEEKWWDDFGFMLREAEKRGMRVWLLDDKHFPSGYANGYVKTHPECRKTLARMEYCDVVGPQTRMKLIVPALLEDESLIAVTAYRRERSGHEFTGEPVDLLFKVEGGMVRWDIPEGYWRVYYIIRTHHLEFYKDNADLITEEGANAMLKAVYEPHYEHFSEFFGNTFVGFFSDEPAFGNGKHYDIKLGNNRFPIPWRDDLPALMAEQGAELSAEKVRIALPMLFHSDREGRYHELRLHYMDVITRLYSELFTKRLGNWCRDHGVLYIGHIIEDMENHQRLGAGAGHFFRALQYQDMSGMDNIQQQIVPGMLDIDHSSLGWGKNADPDFFNYYQSKLASSLAHLTPRMQHRTMCEIFGANGWVEGVPLEKMLADHMLSNGINYYVPHAFSPKYPDPDCPPHFYARGMNPQIEAFGELMNYIRRGAHLVSDGIHRAPIALLYTPEAEWTDGKTLFGRFAGRELTRAQLDFDILWEDILPSVEVREIEGKKYLYAEPESYGALVIPESEFLTQNMIREIQRFIDAGVPVVVTGEGEEILCPASVEKAGGEPLRGAAFVMLSELSDWLRSRELFEITLHPEISTVRYHELTREGKDIYFFCSEDIFREARFTVKMKKEGSYRLYDPWTNRLYRPRQNGTEVEMYLPKAGAIFLVEDDSEAPDFDYMEEPLRELPAEKLKVSVCPAKGEFRVIEAKIGDDVTDIPGMEQFCGVIRYEFSAELTGKEKKLFLGRVGEIAKVSLNGHALGYTVASPYALELGNAVCSGKNDFMIDVVNNLAHRERDRYSAQLPIPPSGLLGPVRIR